MDSDRRFVAALVVVVTLAWGCGEPPTPVGSLRVEPAEVALGFPRYTAIDIHLEPTADLEGGASPYVMVHVLDDSGTVVRTFDHPLPFDWRVGRSETYSIDLYQSALAPPLEPGAYRLTMGLFDPNSGRWALETAGEEVTAQEYVVGSLIAGDSTVGAPKFFFSPTWQATEAGTDVQILGRRWLRGDGQIRLTEIPGAGSLRVHVRVPPADPQTEDLVLSEGYADVALDVTTTCSEETWTFTGLGTHVIDVAIGEGVGRCELAFTPHYQLVTRVNLDGRALAVDLLAWKPTDG